MKKSDQFNVNITATYQTVDQVTTTQTKLIFNNVTSNQLAQILDKLADIEDGMDQKIELVNGVIE